MQGNAGNAGDAGVGGSVSRDHVAVNRSYLSGFGPRVPVSKADANLLQQFAVALTSAMVNARVRLVVVESVAFLFRNSIVPPAYLLGRLLFPRTVADASAMERVFGKSELDWTMVRPRNLQTSLTRESIVCARVTGLVSVSQSRGRMWPIS